MEVIGVKCTCSVKKTIKTYHYEQLKKDKTMNNNNKQQCNTLPQPNKIQVLNMHQL